MKNVECRLSLIKIIMERINELNIAVFIYPKLAVTVSVFPFFFSDLK